jgi:hypothetical protein
MKNAGRRELLRRMDEAFSDYSHKAEQLSVLLAETKDLSSWTSYNELVKQRSIEIVAYDRYRKLKDELFSLIPLPQIQDRPESSIN